MGFMIKLDNPKKYFDWQDIVDLIDEVGRQIDSKDETIKNLLESIGQYIFLLDSNDKKIRQLEDKLKAYQDKYEKE